jgi:hypothetical protein
MVDRIFAILLRLVRSGFDFPSKTAIFFSIIPYLSHAGDEELAELAALLDARISTLPAQFDAIVLDLYSVNSSEQNYLILNFFIGCAVAARDRYYPVVFRISELIVGKLARWQPLATTVFDRLAAFVKESPCDLEREVRFLSALGKRKSGPAVEFRKSIIFPMLDIEPAITRAAFRPTRDEFVETGTGRAIEKVLAGRGISALQRAKREFAAIPEQRPAPVAPLDEGEGKRNITAFLAQRCAAAARLQISRKELFAVRAVNIDAFRPGVADINAISAGDWPTIVW